MRKIATIILGLGSITGVVQAETHAVLPGGSIQAKIDLAVDGDIIAIFGGNYAQDVLVNKKVRLVELAGQDVWITGGITFSGVEDCPPLVGFKVGSSAKGIVVDQVTGLIIKDVVVPRVEVKSSTGIALQNVQTTGEGFSDGVYTNRSKLSIIGGTHREILQDSGTLVVNSSAVSSVHARNEGDASETIVFRTDMTGKIKIDSHGSKTWIGYSKAAYFESYANDAKCVLVGNEVDHNGRHAVSIQGNRGSFLICNNRLRSGFAHTIFVEHELDDIVIQNNFVDVAGWGVLNIRMDSSNAVIRNNIIRGGGGGGAVEGPFGSLVVNNHYINQSLLVRGGVTGSNWSTGGPLTVEGNFFQLAEGSLCIDAGTEDARYNDRDGSRNDIGASGGSWFDPEGWTTENPVVISFDLSSETILQGGGQSVEISEIRAISAP
jgi:hypothetical protein